MTESKKKGGKNPLPNNKPNLPQNYKNNYDSTQPYGYVVEKSITKGYWKKLSIHTTIKSAELWMKFYEIEIGIGDAEWRIKEVYSAIEEEK